LSESPSYICPDCTPDTEDNSDMESEGGGSCVLVDSDEEDSEEDEKIKELLGLADKAIIRFNKKKLTRVDVVV
jgi:hypothetical protein